MRKASCLHSPFLFLGLGPHDATNYLNDGGFPPAHELCRVRDHIQFGSSLTPRLAGKEPEFRLR